MIGNDVDCVCSDSLCDVEGYLAAMLDTRQVWHLHHKVGAVCDRNKETLIEMDLYYHRPANELVFLPPDVHTRLHHYLKVNPQERERLRREEMSNAYAKGLPVDPWILSYDECRSLNEELDEQ